MAEYMENVLETVTIKAYPVIEEIKDFMKSRGALNALMSGSGPTVFGIFEKEEEARKTYDELKEAGLAKNIFVTGWAGMPTEK